MALCASMVLAQEGLAQNSLANPDFDADVSSWSTGSNPYASIGWSPLDVDGSATSGSLGFKNSSPFGPGGAPTTDSECVLVQGDAEYAISTWALVPLEQENTGRPALFLATFANTDCTSPLMMLQLSPAGAVGQWNQISDASWTTPIPAQSARVRLGSFMNETTGFFVVHFDAVDLHPLTPPLPIPALSTPGQLIAAAILLVCGLGIASTTAGAAPARRTVVPRSGPDSRGYDRGHT